MDYLKNAQEQINYDMLFNLKNSDEIALNKMYTLYHYDEDPVIVLIKTLDDSGQEDWEEVSQLLYDPETKGVLYLDV